MNILWITNILFPEASFKLTGNKELRTTGGWMIGAANNLIADQNIKLSIASVSKLVNDLTVFDGEKISYYILPMGKGNKKYNKDYEHYWKQIKKIVCPDVVHIHGTELTHGLAYVNACGSEQVVSSIQGMVSIYARYYLAGLSKSDIFRNYTFRSLIKGSILTEQKDFLKRGLCERELILKISHIIGRTSWDRAQTWAINPEAQYHFCNETLRPEFYDESLWSYEKCDKHTIFLSQAGLPLKGLHQVLKSLPIILNHYPNTKVRVAGSDITLSKGIKGLMSFTDYGRYVKSIIREFGIEDKVLFTGNLNADEMKQEYLHANVFVCPSSIENSPNSLGEAQILGVPCIASLTGGVMDMMKGNEENVYRFEEVEMLAEKICRVFKNGSNQKLMITEAYQRHNPNQNLKQLLSIYNEVMFH